MIAGRDNAPPVQLLGYTATLRFVRRLPPSDIQKSKHGAIADDLDGRAARLGPEHLGHVTTGLPCPPLEHLLVARGIDRTQPGDGRRKAGEPRRWNRIRRGGRYDGEGARSHTSKQASTFAFAFAFHSFAFHGRRKKFRVKYLAQGDLQPVRYINQAIWTRLPLLYFGQQRVYANPNPKPKSQPYILAQRTISLTLTLTSAPTPTATGVASTTIERGMPTVPYRYRTFTRGNSLSVLPSFARSASAMSSSRHTVSALHSTITWTEEGEGRTSRDSGLR